MSVFNSVQNVWLRCRRCSTICWDNPPQHEVHVCFFVFVCFLTAPENASAMLKSYHSPWEQAILSDPDLAESLKLTMPAPDPRPDLPEYRCFNRWEYNTLIKMSPWEIVQWRASFMLNIIYRVATPFGGFDKAPRGITFKLPEVDLNPPSYPELQDPGVKRPTFNRTAQGWISEGTHLILPTITLEPIKVPESDDL